jgi:eukaryotic-like serine/threonine-protein kinase
MSTEVPPTADVRRPDSPARRVDAACDRFEAAWRGGQDPRIEDYLEAAVEAERPALLRALITLEVELRQGRGEHPAPGEYRDRFPGQSARVDAAFAETALRSGMSRPRPSRTREDTSRSLLFGLLALQNNFIDRDALLAALNSWVADRSRSPGQILLERGALSPSRHMLLEALVEEHIRLHDDDPRKSLASLSSIGSVRDDLSRLADPGVQDTLAHVPAARKDTDPDRTASLPSVGGSTSAGIRFRILRPHAKGGVGQVFIAFDTELNRDVALKEIRAHFADDPRYRARFEFEAEVTGGLEHPGIVPVYGLGHTPDGRPFYAMRFIKGNSLKEAIRQFHEAEKQSRRDSGQSTLELRELLGRFIDVCDAVAYAHSRRVLHRDLKPGNIMLGKYGETLVVDWGMAKALDQPEVEGPIERSELPLKPASGSALELTQAGSAVGTPAYMSPEQASGQLDQLGPRSDVYCLGATLYHLLTGQAPCEAEPVGEVYREILAGEIPRPRSLNPRVAPGLEAICLKALALRPGNRYESAEALKADLERWLADEPVSAWREPFSIRARRWARRNRTAVTGAAAALVAGLIGLAAVATVEARANSALGAKNLQLTEEKKKTDEALAQSEESRRQAEAMSTFLVEAFRSPDPSRKGREVKVADVLDRASAKLDREFAGSPATKGALLDALARTYQGLGLYDEAVSLHTRAAAVLEAVLGPDHPDTLRNMNNLASSYHELGRRAEALELFQKTLALRKTRLGPDHPDTLMSMNNLAVSYHELGRRAEALKLREATLALCQAKLGPDHPDTLLTMNNLADSYHDLGRRAEALKLREATLALRQAKLGPDHPLTLASRNNLALAYESLGRLAEAEGLDRDTLARRRMTVPPDSPLLAHDLADLGRNLQMQSRWSEAEPIVRECLAIRQKAAPENWQRYDAMSLLGGALLGQGRFAEAEPLVVAGYEGMKAREARIDMPDRFRLSDAAERVVQLYEAWGKPDQAATWKTKLGMPDLPADVFARP